MRYGSVQDEIGVSAYTVQVRKDDGSPLNLRMTHATQDALFGLAISRHARTPTVGSRPRRADT